MAAKLECEICGGKLIGKPGGIFECEICGTEYSTEWAREKLNGSIPVRNIEKQNNTATTKTANPAFTMENRKIENYLKLGKMALEEYEFEKAAEYYENALNVDAECADAYLGLLLANEELHTVQDIASLCDNSKIARITAMPPYKKFFLFATPAQKKELISLLETARANVDNATQKHTSKAFSYDDNLFPIAVDLVLETGIASVDMLLSGLKIDYARAASIIDEMEDKHFVGPFLSSAPRKILITKKQWEKMKVLIPNASQQLDRLSLATECLQEMGYQQDEIARALSGLDTKHNSVEMLVRLGLRALIGA